MTEPASESTPTVPDDTVIFHVEGEPITVAEARNGHMRQRDYTQKTQQLSAFRREAEQAMQVVSQMERDPKNTLAALGEYFEVTPTVAAPPSADGDVDVPAQAPYESSADLQAMRTQIESLQQNQLATQLRAEMEAIQAQDPSVDIELLVQRTRDEGYPNLTTAYKVMKAETATPLTETVPTPDPSGVAADAAITDAKRDVSGAIANGTGTPEGAASDPTPETYDSPASAAAAAIRSLEASGQLVES